MSGGFTGKGRLERLSCRLDCHDDDNDYGTMVYVLGVFCCLAYTAWFLDGSFMYNIGRQSGKRKGEFRQ